VCAAIAGAGIFAALIRVPKGTPQRSAAYHRRDKVMLTSSPFAAIPIPKLLKINSGKPWHG
jgi:hypothetical protein